MIQNRLKGMGVALVTPFNEDGEVDYESLAKLVRYVISNHADFLCVLGTTAETPTLTEEEKHRIRKTIVEIVNGKVPILLGVGGNCTRTVVNELKNDKFEGIDAILSVVPYYNKPTQEGIYQHFKAVSEASPLPIVLYNIPGRTGVNMLPETTLRIARDFENVVAIKEASGNIRQIAEIIKHKPEGFDVISGDDGLTYPMMTLGAVGVISVLGNACPAQFSKMVRLAMKGDFTSAAAIHTEFVELIKLLFVDGNPAGVKALLYSMGIIQNQLRLPLVPASPETVAAISKVAFELNR